MENKSPIRLILLVIALLSFLILIIWLIFQPGYEAILAFLTALVSFFVSNYFKPGFYVPESVKEEYFYKSPTFDVKMGFLT